MGGIAHGTVLAIGSRPAWKAGVWGNPDCRFEPCLFRHHNTVFGPSRLTISNLRAILKQAKDCIFIWSNVIIGSQPVSKAGVPQGIAGSSPACSARYAAVAIMERARQNGCRSQSGVPEAPKGRNAEDWRDSGPLKCVGKRVILIDMLRRRVRVQIPSAAPKLKKKRNHMGQYPNW